MEGVKRYEVKLLPHNKAWEIEFEKTKKVLEKAWKDNVIDIQHVGSTSITAISAKPILDIAVKLNSIKDMDVEALTSIGYDYCGISNGDENHHLFVLRGENEMSYEHIHCYDKKDECFDQLVGFRDYLNAHIDDAKKYEDIKIKLAEHHASDRQAYTSGKAEFINLIYEKISNNK